MCFGKFKAILRNIFVWGGKGMMGGSKKLSEHELRTLRAKVVMAGLRINDVGRKTGYHPSHVTHVLAGRRHNQKIIDFIERLA